MLKDTVVKHWPEDDLARYQCLAALVSFLSTSDEANCPVPDPKNPGEKMHWDSPGTAQSVTARVLWFVGFAGRMYILPVKNLALILQEFYLSG